MVASTRRGKERCQKGEKGDKEKTMSMMGGAVFAHNMDVTTF